MAQTAVRHKHNRTEPKGSTLITERSSKRTYAHVVHNGGAGKQYLVRGCHLLNRFTYFRVVISDLVGFVKYYVIPSHSVKDFVVFLNNPCCALKKGCNIRTISRQADALRGREII